MIGIRKMIVFLVPLGGCCTPPILQVKQRKGTKGIGLSIPCYSFLALARLEHKNVNVLGSRPAAWTNQGWLSTHDAVV